MGNSNDTRGNCDCNKQRLMDLTYENENYLKKQESFLNEIQHLKNEIKQTTQISQETNAAVGINREAIRCANTTADLMLYKNDINNLNCKIAKLEQHLVDEQRKVKNFNDLIFNKSQMVELDSRVLTVYFINSINEIMPSLKLTKSENYNREAIIAAVVEFTNNALIGVESIESVCSLNNLDRNVSNDVFIANVYYYLVEFYSSISIFIEN